MIANTNKYVHDVDIHNLIAPKEIVPIIMNMFNPKSVVDVGCGIGTFLYVFKQAGVRDVLGIDGSWVDRSLLGKYISETEFRSADLEKEIKIGRKFDLVLSLEVAEHLDERVATLFVKSLVSLGDVIVFSAAIPFQGGQNHINEQWITYWEEKFAAFNYETHDVLRPLLWNNPKVFWWYKQNIIVVAKKGYVFKVEVTRNPIRNIIHPEKYLDNVKFISEIKRSLWFRIFYKIYTKARFQKNTLLDEASLNTK